MKPVELFSAHHNATTIVRVIFGRDVGDGSRGLDIVLSGRLAARLYSPEAVNAWFASHSKKLLEPWRAAFHRANIAPGQFQRPSPQDVTLAVPYRSQRNNKRDPMGTCNVTSYGMCMEFEGAKPTGIGNFAQFEDELEYFLAQKGRDRHLHGDLAWMGRQYGVNSRFDIDRTLDEMRAQLRGGHPVVLSGLFTRSGHIIVLIGTKGEDFVVHDPFGNALTRYKSHDGEGLVYPGDYILKVGRAPGKNQKWAHFFGDAT